MPDLDRASKLQKKGKISEISEYLFPDFDSIKYNVLYTYILGRQ